MYRSAIFLLGFLSGCSASPSPATESGNGGSAGGNGSAMAGGNTSSGGESSSAGGTGGGANGGSSAAGGSNPTSGGSSAGGSSAGSGGGNTVIHDCASPAPVGTWENISPLQFTTNGGNPVIPSVVIDATDPATLYIAGGDKPCCGSGSNGVWKSTDCGATWTKVNTGSNADTLDAGWLWSLVIDPNNPQIMWGVNGYGNPASLFKTTDGGVNWDKAFGSEVTQYLNSDFVQIVSMDPTNPDHVVVTIHDSCTGPYAPACLVETKNGGASWNLIKSPVDGWQEASGPVILGPDTLLLATPFQGLWYTENGGTSWEKVRPNGAPAFYQSSDGNMYLGSNDGVLTSNDGHSWSVLENSPKSNTVLGDGSALWASMSYDTTGQPIYSALLSSLSDWTNVQTPTMPKAGAGAMAYDPGRHILYAAAWDAGLWRVVTH